MSDRVEWLAWLERWNRILLDRYDPDAADAFVDPLVTRDVIRSGWLGAPGAGESELAALESRLGAALPASYRSFLAASNGFLQPGVIVPRLLPAHEVSPLRVTAPELLDVYAELERELGSLGAIERALPGTIQVSARETVGTAVYLLDPGSIGPDGEWAAYYFADWIPGGVRHPSFRALMESEMERLLAPPPPPPPGRLETWMSVVKWIFSPQRSS